MTDEAGAQKSREQLIVDKDFLYAENRRLRAKLAEADDRVVSYYVPEIKRLQDKCDAAEAKDFVRGLERAKEIAQYTPYNQAWRVANAIAAEIAREKNGQKENDLNRNP